MADQMNERELVYDWNDDGAEAPSTRTRVGLDDETLRDGVQSASVTDPSTKDKIRLVHLMDEIGIETADIGLPGAGPRMFADSLEIAREMVSSRLSIAANCAARTVIGDISPIVELSQKAGIQIEAALFIGTSPIREYVEGWTLDQMLERTEESVRYAKDNGLLVMYVTEDTTRARPETIERMYSTAIDAGADRLCVADTVGHATPRGSAAVVGFVKSIVEKQGRNVGIDWHGHRDRGLDIANALAAIDAGATRVHGTALGIGERSGNAPMELLLVNLRMLGYIDNDLSRLSEYCEFASNATGVPIPVHQPVVGEDAFRTCTGVHASALRKAQKKGHRWLADRIYSAVPSEWVGRRQIVEIGPLSGKSNVLCWLEDHGHEPGDELAHSILEAAKSTNRRLRDNEIEDIIKQHA